ncbi:hypothetical protein [Alkalibacillus haloalkaliphilus]|uniref:Uncharacterized protein n=1 Tax=Alkalibacillus haloalkaliphilus TaxID=94136 RepID=A0A511W5N2_9BACI|nr:hypothetical protein [Alkalibacillus haloalkaliphilus]GEN46071.1 hypothetical protein AHA02nite_18470 [Alkalibacillus haloalkaliphilus]
MRQGRNGHNDERNDLFHRGLIGNPGCMLVLIVLIIVISIIVNYFD